MLLQGVGGQTMSFYIGTAGVATYKLYKADGTVAAGAGVVTVVTDNAQPIATIAFTAGELNVLGTLLVCVLDFAGVLNGDQEDVVPAYPPAGFAAAVRAAIGMGGADLDAQLATLAVPGDAMTLTGGAETALATAILDLANAVEVGLTVRQALRLASAVLGGLVALTPGVATFKGAGVVTNRVLASVPGDGSRPAVTLTL